MTDIMFISSDGTNNTFVRRNQEGVEPGVCFSWMLIEPVWFSGHLASVPETDLLHDARVEGGEHADIEEHMMNSPAVDEEVDRVGRGGADCACREGAGFGAVRVITV